MVSGEEGKPRAAMPGRGPVERDEPPRELPGAVRTFIEARTGDAVFVVGPDYRIVHWDDGMEALTGTLAEEAVGERCFGVDLGEREGGGPFCAHGCSVMYLAQARRPVSSYEMRINTRSGQKRWVNVSNLTVETEEGPYLVHLLRDSQGTHDALEMARGSSSFLPRRRPLPQEGGTSQPSPRASSRSLSCWPRASPSRRSEGSSTSLRPRSGTTSARCYRPWGPTRNSRSWPRLERWASSPAKAVFP